MALRTTEGTTGWYTAVVDGRLPLAGKDLPASTWSVPPPGPAAAAAMEFGWLLDLKALGTEARGARPDLIRGWIRAHPRWHEQAWRPGSSAAG